MGFTPLFLSGLIVGNRGSIGPCHELIDQFASPRCGLPRASELTTCGEKRRI